MVPTSAGAVVTGITVLVSTSSVAGFAQPPTASVPTTNALPIDRKAIMGGVPRSHARGSRARPEGPMRFGASAIAYLAMPAAPAVVRRCRFGQAGTHLRPSAPPAAPAAEFRSDIGDMPCVARRPQQRPTTPLP